MGSGLEYWLLRNGAEYCVIATNIGHAPSVLLAAGWSRIEVFYWRLDAILEKARLEDTPVNYEAATV